MNRYIPLPYYEYYLNIQPDGDDVWPNPCYPNEPFSPISKIEPDSEVSDTDQHILEFEFQDDTFTLVANYDHEPPYLS